MDALLRRAGCRPSRTSGWPTELVAYARRVEWLVAFGILSGLVLLLVWTRRRWGEPRLYVRGKAALWLAAAIVAAIVLWLAVD
jgi:hypothetical protein